MILLSTIAEFHLWKKVKLWKISPFQRIFCPLKNLMSNFYTTVKVVDRIMSTTIIVLPQKFNANDVNITVILLSYFLRAANGGVEDMVGQLFM